MTKDGLDKSNLPNEDDDRYLINDVDDYIYEYGVRVNEKGERIMNTECIYLHNYRILIKHSLFKHDMSLLKRLSKLPVCGRSELLRMVIEAIVSHNLKNKELVDLTGIEFLLKDDLT